MFKGLGQLASLMRGATEISGKLESFSKALEEKRVVGAAGGDMVRVEMNGLSQVTQVTIDPALVSGGDREMLETLIAAAVNQASAKAKEQHVAMMRELTGGIDLPGFDQLMSRFNEDDSREPDRP
jgi:DNA-binding YbaB/EbfC family protein